MRIRTEHDLAWRGDLFLYEHLVADASPHIKQAHALFLGKLAYLVLRIGSAHRGGWGYVVERHHQLGRVFNVGRAQLVLHDADDAGGERVVAHHHVWLDHHQVPWAYRASCGM